MKKLLVLLVLLVSGLGYSQNFKLSDVVGYVGRFDYVLDENWDLRIDTLSLTENVGGFIETRVHSG
jgi:hypothetical protein